MNGNKEIGFSTGKRFALDTIGAYLLWGVLYGIGMSLIVLAVKFLSEIVLFSFDTETFAIVYTILSIMLVYLMLFFIFKFNWKSAIRSAFGRGNLYKKDVPTVKRGITIFVAITVALGLILILMNTVSQINMINVNLESLNQYEDNLLTQTSIKNLETTKTVTIITTIISAIISILINKYMINFATKRVMLGAIDDVENIQPENVKYNQKRTSLFVVALIVYVVIILIPIICAATLALSNLGTSSMNNATNNIGGTLEKITLAEAKTIASIAWKKALLDTTINTDEEYYNYIINYMTQEGIDVNDYNVTATVGGVSVALRGQEPSMEDNNEGNEAVKPDIPSGDTPNVDKNDKEENDNNRLYTEINNRLTRVEKGLDMLESDDEPNMQEYQYLLDDMEYINNNVTNLNESQKATLKKRLKDISERLETIIQNNNTTIIDSASVTVLKNNYGNLTDKLAMAYSNLKFEAAFGSNAQAVIDTKDAAKAYEVVILESGFGNVTLMENVAVECSMTKRPYTAKFTITLKPDGEYILSKLQVEKLKQEE